MNVTYNPIAQFDGLAYDEGFLSRLGERVVDFESYKHYLFYRDDCAN